MQIDEFLEMAFSGSVAQKIRLFKIPALLEPFFIFGFVVFVELLVV